MDCFKSSVARLLSNKNTGGLCRELKVTKEQAERIYREYYCNFPLTDITVSALGSKERQTRDEI